MKKYFLTFCTLALGMLTALWVCAQSENTASEKTPGEQLLEFQKNLPAKYDVGLIRIQQTGNGQWDTYYHRVKKDGDLAYFKAVGLTTNTLYSTEIGPLANYLFIRSKYENAYWKSGKSSENQLELTTWTNKGIPSEENNQFLEGMNLSFKSDASMLKIIAGLKEAVPESHNHYYITNEMGEKIASFSLIFDEQGRIIRQDFVNDVPRYPFGVTNVSLLGSVYHFGYETNLGVPFFPSKTISMDIYKIFKEDGSIRVSTNYSGTNFYVYLNTNPNLDKSKFALIPYDTDNYKHFWVEGTNILFTNYYGKIDRLLTKEEADELNKAYEMRNSNYRYLYFILAFVIILITFILTIRIKK